MKQVKRFLSIRRAALKIMRQVYDPFHDHVHAREVERTALQIYQQLPIKTQQTVDLELLRLVSILHDSSRKVIGTNLFLEPLLGGYISGYIAYHLMKEAGYNEKKARYVLSLLRNHESFLGLWRYPADIHEKILEDADLIEQYSMKRLARGITYFKQKKFSNFLFNLYIFGLIMMHSLFTPHFHFKISRELSKQNVEELQRFLLHKKKTFGQLLYQRIFTLLYTKVISKYQNNF
ncbi:HD domain-containing protein [Candidatus Woesebacteria bacterium]|nr:HD domain-containing protein [Candidatus Woesebacteria bacterium]